MVRRRADAFDAMRLHRRCEQGLALIAVLWIVAALSILVTGLGQTVRQKAQAVGTTRQSIAAQALGDAAVHTALQRLAALPAPPDGLVLDRVEHGGVPIVVSVQPLDGLIDLNNASAELLTQTLVVGAALAPPQAAQLAKRIIDWREQRSTSGASARFESVDDLLLVPELEYQVYADIKNLVTADMVGDGRVNPKSAGPDVLMVLARGDRALVDSFVAARQAARPGLDTTGFDARFVRAGGSASGRYWVSASVPMDERRTFLFGRLVLAGLGNDPGVHWRTAATRSLVQSVPARD